jgi:hypothetical protein
MVISSSVSPAGRVVLPRALKVAGILLVLCCLLVTLLVLGVLGLMSADLVRNEPLLAGVVTLAAVTLPVWPLAALVSATRGRRVPRASWWLWPLLVVSGALAMVGLSWISGASAGSGCAMFCDLALAAGLLALGAAAVLGALGWWVRSGLRAHAENLRGR